MSRLPGYAVAAACLLSWPLAAAASDPLPADAYALFPAGKSVVAISADARLWRRDEAQGAPWQEMPLQDGETYVSAVTCAADDSGICTVTAATAAGVVLDRFDSASGDLARLPMGTGEVTGMPDRDTIDLTRPDPSGGTSLVRYSISGNRSEIIGVLAPGEQLMVLPLDGKMTPAAFTYGGGLRELATGTPIDFVIVENLLWQRDGLLLRELWTHEPSAVKGHRAVANIRFERQVKDGKPVWRNIENLVTALPVSGPLFDERNGAVDANDDMAAELLGNGVDKIGVLCRQASGDYGFRGMLDIRPGQTTSLTGTISGEGFILRTDSMLHTPQFDILTLSPSAGGWRERNCDNTTFTLSGADVAVEENQDLELMPLQAKSADGTTVPYYVLKVKNVVPEHVLIDVYGAYGYKHDFEAYHDKAVAMMRDTKTAIAFAIVRGDGDLGYDYAVASRHPYRQRAVDDVIAVASDVAGRYPGLTDKPTVRGQSAGAWLAVKSVLSRPDLFSGAIGYSGLYLLKDDPLGAEGNGYFTFDDDLTPVLKAATGACPALHFRFLHAKDDPKTKYDKAVAFSEQLKAAGCPVEFVSFDGGGHDIDIKPGQEADAERRLEGYFSPF